MMKTILFLLHADYSVSIRRFLLLSKQLFENGVVPVFLDFSCELKDKLQEYAKELNCDDMYVYKSMNDFTLTQEEANKYLGKIDTSKQFDRQITQDDSISNLLNELEFDFTDILKQHKDEFLNPFIAKYVQAMKVLEYLQPSLIVYDLELDKATRGMLFAAQHTGTPILSMQHGEGNAEQYKHFPLMADYYTAYSPFNVKILLEMGIDKRNILLTGAPETDLLTGLDKNKIENELQQYGYNPALKTILISLKPSNTGNYKAVNKKIIEDALSLLKLRDDYQLIIKLHPNDCHNNVDYVHAYSGNGNTVVIGGSYMISKLFMISDVILTSYSTAIVEACALGKKVIVIKEDAKVEWPDWNHYNVFTECELGELPETLANITDNEYVISQEDTVNFSYYFRYKLDKENTTRLAGAIAELVYKTHTDDGSIYKMQQEEIEDAIHNFESPEHKRNTNETEIDKSRKIKIYTDKRLLPQNQNWNSFLIPFWGNNEQEDSAKIHTRYNYWEKSAHNYYELTDKHEADYFMLPGEYDKQLMPSYHEFVNEAKSLGKKVIVFYNNDSTENIDIENGIVFRTSFYDSQRKENEHAIPGFCEDFTKIYFDNNLGSLDKKDKPRISFCGFIPEEQYRPAYVRKFAIDELANNDSIECNIVVRNKFWGGAIDGGKLSKNVDEIHMEYLNNLRSGDFVLCVRGEGNFSYRLYETMCAGRIPVIVDTDIVLPYEDIIDWKNICVWVKADELNTIGDKIIKYYNGLTNEEIVGRKKLCRQLWGEYLSPEGFFKNLPLILNKYNNRVAAMPNKSYESILEKLRSANIEEENYLTNVYPEEKKVINILKNIIEPGWITADVGANNGRVAIVLGQLVGAGGKVYAFEAMPDNCSMMANNINTVKFDDRVVVENIAVSDGSDDEIDLYPGRNNSPEEWNIVGHDVDGNITEAACKIKAASLDNYFTDKQAPDFIKIDIEGAAKLAIEGMRKILQNDKPILFVEFHDDTEWSARDILFDNDYNLYDLDGSLIPASNNEPRHYQCFAIPSIKGETDMDVNSSSGKTKCLFINTYYAKFIEQFYKNNPQFVNAPYQQQLDELRSSYFGDSFFYSKWLTEAGVHSDDLIINSMPLQHVWKNEHNLNPQLSELEVCLEQIKTVKPDVVYLQDLSFATKEFIEHVRPYVKLIVGQIASPLPDAAYAEGFDIIISSFPHYVNMFRSKGITSYYQPLAFEPSVLEHIEQEKEIDVSFVGGLSALHDERRELLGYLSTRVPLNVYGSGIESLDPNSNIRKIYRGEAWGTGMFGTLAKSRITVNHHHSVAENYANNMRLFEATGTGALLITDYRDNLNDLFDIGKEVVVYRSKEECAALIQYYMRNPEEAEAIAKAGQQKTLRDHTYEKRMVHTAEIIKRHLRYKEEELEEPDLEHISWGHSEIDSGQVTTNLTSAWKSEAIPAKQRALVNRELEQMYKGNPPLVYRVLAESLRPYTKTNTSVLEIGCASGYYYEILEYLLNKRINFTGVDYSEALIRMAKDYYPGINFEAADGADLPFDDEKFEISISSGILLHVPNYREHIKETVRVASNVVIAHRTPVCRKRKTQFYKKYAYGEETVELRFNENEILNLFVAQGLRLERYYEYYTDKNKDEYEVTYIFKKV